MIVRFYIGGVLQHIDYLLFEEWMYSLRISDFSYAGYLRSAFEIPLH